MAQNEQAFTVNTLRISLYATAAFAVLFGLGIYGYLAHGHTLLQALYGTIKLVLIDGPDFILQNGHWTLVVATFTLPLFPAAALLSLLGAAAGVQWQLLRVMLQPRQHVFLGAGKMALSVAHSLAERGESSILAIDTNTEGVHARAIGAKPGALIFQHDVDNSLLLRKLRLAQADTVYVFTGNDAQNLSVARKVIQLLGNADTPPRLVINVESHELLNLVTEEAIFRGYQQRAELLWFSAPQQKAREISKRFPLRLHSTLQQPGAIHIAVVGQCAESDALVLQLAKQNALLRDERMHVTVFGQSAEQFSAFMRNHPVLSARQHEPEYGGVAPLIQLQFVAIGNDGVSVRAVREAIEAQQQLPLHVAYVIEPDDYRGITETVRMCQVSAAMNLSTRLVTCIAGRDFAAIDDVRKAVAHYGVAMQQVAWFHGLHDLFDSHEQYPGELSDVFGLLVHTAYKAIFTEPTLQADQEQLQQQFEQRFKTIETLARQEWLAQLPEAFRASSRQSGDHIFVKLRELGFVLRRRTTQDSPGISETMITLVDAAISKHLDELLHLEHTRFCIERLIDGWLFHASNNKHLKLNKTLVPFDALSAQEVFKDEVIIRVMPVLLRHPYVQQHYALEAV